VYFKLLEKNWCVLFLWKLFTLQWVEKIEVSWSKLKKRLTHFYVDIFTWFEWERKIIWGVFAYYGRSETKFEVFLNSKWTEWKLEAFFVDLYYERSELKDSLKFFLCISRVVVSNEVQRKIGRFWTVNEVRWKRKFEKKETWTFFANPELGFSPKPALRHRMDRFEKPIKRPASTKNYTTLYN
jgi:hypothetical protein